MNFHDENYEGIVIKIPTGLIVTNKNLADDVNAFKDALLKCEYSTAHPHHEKNIFEIENYHEKRKYLLENKRKEKEDQNRRTLRNKNLADHNIIPIARTDIRDGYGLENLEINGVEYNQRDLLTKRGVTGKVKKHYSEFIKKCSPKEFISFLNKNSFRSASYLASKCKKESVLYWRSHLYNDCYGVAICLPIETVHIYRRGKRDNRKLLYTETWLFYDSEEGEYYINSGHLSESELHKTDGGQEYRSYLRGYEREGNQFVKTLKEDR